MIRVIFLLLLLPSFALGSDYLEEETNIHRFFGQNRREMPQAMTVLTRQYMQDRNISSFKDALRSVSGVNLNSLESGNGKSGDNFNIRGQNASKDIFLDGMRDSTQYFRDVFNVERVEVLKGSHSAVFGSGVLGGVVNQVSKEPGLKNKKSAKVTGGSHGFFRAVLDVNERIGQNSAFRLNVMKNDAKSYRDAVTQDSVGFAPSVKFGIGTQNELLLSHYLLDYKNVPDYGIPIPARQDAKPISVPGDTFYGLKNLDSQKDRIHISKIVLKNEFDSESNLVTKIMRVENQRRMIANRPLKSGSGLINRDTHGRVGRERQLILQSNYNSIFELFSLRHKALLGVEFSQKRDRRSSIDASNAAPVSVLNPDYNASYSGSLVEKNPLRMKNYEMGVYLQDLVEVAPKWQVLFGARLSRYRTDFSMHSDDLGEDISYKTSDSFLAYNFGVNYEANADSNYYFSHGVSFSAAGDLNNSGSVSEAGAGGASGTGKVINNEIGGKWRFFGGKLMTNLAVFHVNNVRSQVLDPDDNSRFLLSEKKYSSGVEIQADGKINDKLDLFFNFTMLRSRISDDLNIHAEGMRLSNTASNSGNLWLRYKILPKMRIGGGVSYVGQKYGFSTSNLSSSPLARKLPAYTRLDAMVGWYGKEYDIELNILNLLDEEYYESMHDWGFHATPGIDRQFQLGVTYKF